MSGRGCDPDVTQPGLPGGIGGERQDIVAPLAQCRDRHHWLNEGGERLGMASNRSAVTAQARSGRFPSAAGTRRFCRARSACARDSWAAHAGRESTFSTMRRCRVLTAQESRGTARPPHARVPGRQRIGCGSPDGLGEPMQVRAAIDAAERNGTRVLIRPAQLGSSSASGWAADYASVAFQATKHLLDQGIWPIVMLGGNENSVVGRLLRRGYIQACTQSGLPEKETECVYAGLTADSARAHADKLLESENPPAGFVTATVPIALGVMAALADKKLDIPREVSLVACEDVRLAEQLKPILTTAGTDIVAQGQTMSLALIDAIEGHPASLRSLETRLTIRESSGFPSAATTTPDT